MKLMFKSQVLNPVYILPRNLFLYTHIKQYIFGCVYTYVYGGNKTIIQTE